MPPLRLPLGGFPKSISPPSSPPTANTVNLPPLPIKNSPSNVVPLVFASALFALAKAPFAYVAAEFATCDGVFAAIAVPFARANAPLA